MSSFEKLLIHWNGGIKKGAQTRLAKTLKITQPTIARWVSGVAIPHEDIRARLAKCLNIKNEELLAAFKNSQGLTYRVRQVGASWAGDGLGSKEISGLIPVLCQISSPRFSFNFNGLPLEYLPFGYPGMERRWAAAAVVNDSLIPFCRTGDYVIVAESKEGEEGKWALFSRGNERFFGLWTHRQKTEPDTSHPKPTVEGIVIGLFRRP